LIPSASLPAQPHHHALNASPRLWNAVPEYRDWFYKRIDARRTQTVTRENPITLHAEVIARQRFNVP